VTKKAKGGFINQVVLRLGSRVTDWSSCSKGNRNSEEYPHWFASLIEMCNKPS